MKNKQVILSFALTLIGLSAVGQQKMIAGSPSLPASNKMPTDAVWTKTIIREVLMEDTASTENRKLKKAKNDSLLAQILSVNLLKQKLTAYNLENGTLSAPLPPAKVAEMLSTKPDSITMDDPITGKPITKIFKPDVPYDLMYMYRVLEEWTFDRATGKTNIQIIAIAPMMDIYGDEGSFHGRRTQYWVKYNEVREILARYEHSHPDSNLSLAVWKDYFSETK